MLRMLIGVDGRAGGRDAIALASAFAGNGAAARSAEMALAQVVPYGLVAPRANSESALARANELLAREALLCPQPAARYVVIEQSVASGLAGLGHQLGADLIVVGATSRHGLVRLVLGDDAANLIDVAPCAVAVAPPHFHGLADPSHVGVLVDETEAGQHALEFAERLAVTLSAPLDMISPHEDKAASALDVTVVAARIGQLPHLPGRRSTAANLARSSGGVVVVVPMHSRAPLEWLQPA